MIISHIDKTIINNVNDDDDTDNDGRSVDESRACGSNGIEMALALFLIFVAFTLFFFKFIIRITVNWVNKQFYVNDSRKENCNEFPWTFFGKEIILFPFLFHWFMEFTIVCMKPCIAVKSSRCVWKWPKAVFSVYMHCVCGFLFVSECVCECVCVHERVCVCVCVWYQIN